MSARVSSEICPSQKLSVWARAWRPFKVDSLLSGQNLWYHGYNLIFLVKHYDDCLQMETFSALLALCVGNSPVTGEFPPQRPVMQSFDVLSHLHQNKWLSKQSRRRWLYPPKRSLGGVYWIHPVRLSVCPSVRPSVRPSVGRCPDDNSNSFQWI